MATRLPSLGVPVFAAGLAASAGAQCGRPGVDLVVTDIAAPVNYAVSGGFEGLACGYSLTNVGDAPAPCEAGTAVHPVVTAGLYCIATEEGVSSIRQIALSWANHEFFPLAQGVACVCTPAGGSAFGVGCTSPTASSTVGTPTQRKGPRWQLDPWTGVGAWLPAQPPYSPDTARRLAPRVADLDRARRSSGRLVVELQALVPGEPATNRVNNTSRRGLALTGGDGGQYTFAVSGSVAAGSPAIEAWREVDPAVTVVRVQTPEGVAYAAWVVVEAGPGLWRYRYAVENVSVARGFAGLEFSTRCGAVPQRPVFSAPEYHDGDGIPTDPSHPNTTARNFDATPWVFHAGAGGTGWRVATPADPNANALRWGTLFTFGFDSTLPPRPGAAVLTYFGEGGPAAVVIEGAATPTTEPPSQADFNGDGFVDQFDYADFVRCFEGAGCPPGRTADVNTDGFADLFDYLEFVEAFERGC